MLFKIDYTKRNDHKQGSDFVNFAADEVEATKSFMDNFFRHNPGDAVRIDRITKVEITGDMTTAIDVIDAATKSDEGEQG